MAKGRFIPRNPQKYRGNPQNIFFRSSWELTVCKFFDSNPSINCWASEEISIQYISPKDGKVHRYYPDFFVELLNAQQQVERWLIEVKPLKETKIEYAKTVYDKIAIAINEAKWNAAEKFALMNGMKFKVITELDIYRMAPKNKQPKKTISTKKPTTTVGTKKTKSTTKQRKTK